MKSKLKLDLKNELAAGRSADSNRPSKCLPSLVMPEKLSIRVNSDNSNKKAVCLFWITFALLLTAVFVTSNYSPSPPTQPPIPSPSRATTANSRTPITTTAPIPSPSKRDCWFAPTSISSILASDSSCATSPPSTSSHRSTSSSSPRPNRPSPYVSNSSCRNQADD